jgi:hypothetical protein
LQVRTILSWIIERVRKSNRVQACLNGGGWGGSGVHIPVIYALLPFILFPKMNLGLILPVFKEAIADNRE